MAMTDPTLIVLGVAQDAGHPLAGCGVGGGEPAGGDAARGHRVSCLGLVDPASGGRWLIDATPDLPRQLRLLTEAAGPGPLSGILLTHAHIGHYTGLMYLGREAMDARGVPIYAMPRMRGFLETHAPWEALVRGGNARLVPLADGEAAALAPGLTVTPHAVPHRDEYSETVAFSIRGPRASALYAPDIDTWGPRGGAFERLALSADRAWVDGTFYSADELPGRDGAVIPHPPIARTIARLPAAARGRVVFIHLNHTNPCLDPASEEARRVVKAGFRVAFEGEAFSL